MSVSFSLKKAQPTASASKGAAPSLRKPAVFASLDDDAPVDAAPTASSSNAKGTAANRTLANQAAKLSRTQQKVAEEARRVDASVYEYDEVYDKMQAAKARQKELKEAETQERKPKYIGNLLHTATVRKLDHLRAEEKMIQREREAEGDEFADKDQFVTQAYKDQMAEVRKAEQEEKAREEAEKAKRKQSSGMSHFYRQLLDQQEADHSATVAAIQDTPASSNPRGPIGPENLTITKPDDFEPAAQTDADKVRIARAEGKDVEVNDDGQIVDSRELLSAGLNLGGTNTRKLGLTLKRKGAAADGDEPVVKHRAVGSAATQREINERRRREIQSQLTQENDRSQREKEQKERERLARNTAKRNTADDVQSAKERYLERKRRKLEEAAQNPPTEAS